MNTINIKQKVKSNQGIVLIVLLVVVVGGFVAYQQYAIWANKHKFEQARASIDTLYTDIVTQVRKPDKVERSQTCGYAARKYERGPLSCGDYLYLVYGVADDSQATDIANNLVTVMSTDKDFEVTFSDVATNLPFTPISDGREKELGLDLIEKKSGMHCSTEYIFAAKGDDSLYLSTDSTDLNLSIAFVCQGDARTEHYDLKKY
jgi:hypothetical protein